MAGERWNVGEPREFTLEFRNAAAILTDPDAVTITVLRPDRTLYTVDSTAVTHPAVGRYGFTYTAAAAGEHIFRIVSTGAVQTVTEQTLYAVPLFEAATDESHARADALLALGRMVAAEQAPRMSDEDLNRLIDYAQRGDGTYNLQKAAAEGWRWKAGRVSGGFSFSADGVAVDKTMLVKHMLAMAEAFDAQAKRGGGGVRTVPLVTDLPVVWS